MARMSRSSRSNVTATSSRQQQQPPSSSIFSVPAPIKQLFDQFPLLTYPVNEFPQRVPQHGNAHVLYVFTTDQGALQGAPSYNPACLKWQVRLSPNPTLTPPPIPQADHSTGLPQVLQDTLPNRLGKQPRLTKRLPPLPDRLLARSIQASAADSLEQTAALGHEQQRQGN